MLIKYSKGSLIIMLVGGLLSVLALVSQLLIPYSSKVLVDGVLIDGSIFSQSYNILFTKAEEEVLLKP